MVCSTSSYGQRKVCHSHTRHIQNNTNIIPNLESNRIEKIMETLETLETLEKVPDLNEPVLEKLHFYKEEVQKT